MFLENIKGEFLPSAVSWKGGVVPKFRSTEGIKLETKYTQTIILQKMR
jgi:hypothetical protein